MYYFLLRVYFYSVFLHMQEDMSGYQFTPITKNNTQLKVYIKVPITLPGTQKWQQTGSKLALNNLSGNWFLM